MKVLRGWKQTLTSMCSEEVQKIHHAEIALSAKHLAKIAFEEVQYELDFAIGKLTNFIDSLDASVYALMKVPIIEFRLIF